jgi:hypothetical protein
MTASAVNLGHDVAAADRLEPATLENNPAARRAVEPAPGADACKTEPPF